MKVYIKSRKNEYEAFGDFNKNTKQLKVLKGSKISSKIAYSDKFKGANTIEKMRKGKILNNILETDIIFKSPSTAANFVTGRSTNGLIAWKTEDGKKIKDLFVE